jgi:hypothetical protein
MKWNAKEIELYGLIILSIVTLVALLAYTFVHTGGLLSEYVNPPWIGYVAAFGVEAAIITMSIRIGKLLRQLAQSAYKGAEGWLSLLWQGSTLLFVLAVSAAANVVEGHKVKYGLELTLSTIQNLDGLQLATGLLATGLIPVVVLSMTEIVSGEIKAALQTVEPQLQEAVQELDAIEADMQEVRIEPAMQEPVLRGLIADLHAEEKDLQEDVTPLQEKPATVSDDAWLAWELAQSGKSQGEIATAMQKNASTIYRWLQKVERELQV